ncbi:MAG: DNA polymerase III subunit delta [Clostridia bacterium]|nr:DNA polymerase III subunit delta [Clostridia bacterium]
MEIMKEEGFRKQLKSGLSGGYLFFGEEDYLKAFSLKAARDAVCEDKSFEIFNDMKIDALDYSAPALLDALMPFPMMSEKKIVTVNGICPDSMKPSEIDDLCDALTALSEYDYNVLIISVPAGGIDEGNLPKRPSALLTRLSKYLTPVRFEPISPARLVSWVGKHFAHNGVTASPEVCSFMIDYCGASMFTLAAETDKLAYYVLQHGRGEVTREDVKNVSIAEISSDTFALANAILDARYDAALEALSVMKFRRVEPVIILSEVSKVICDLVSIKAMMEEGKSSFEISSALKMNEYRVRMYMSGAAGKTMKKLKRAIELCAEADVALKLSPQGYTAIEKLICSL